MTPLPFTNQRSGHFTIKTSMTVKASKAAHTKQMEVSHMNKNYDKANKDITCKEAGEIVRDMIQAVEDRMADDGKTNPKSDDNNEKSQG